MGIHNINYIRSLYIVIKPYIGIYIILYCSAYIIIRHCVQPGVETKAFVSFAIVFRKRNHTKSKLLASVYNISSAPLNH